MRNLMQALWRDEKGFIISTELILIATVMLTTLVTGLACLRCAVVEEMTDLGNAIGCLNQSYMTSGVASWKRNGRIKAATSGSMFVDVNDRGTVGLTGAQFHGGYHTGRPSKVRELILPSRCVPNSPCGKTGCDRCHGARECEKCPDNCPEIPSPDCPPPKPATGVEPSTNTPLKVPSVEASVAT